MAKSLLAVALGLCVFLESPHAIVASPRKPSKANAAALQTDRQAIAADREKLKTDRTAGNAEQIAADQKQLDADVKALEAKARALSQKIHAAHRRRSGQLRPNRNAPLQAPNAARNIPRQPRQMPLGDALSDPPAQTTLKPSELLQGNVPVENIHMNALRRALSP